MEPTTITAELLGGSGAQIVAGLKLEDGFFWATALGMTIGVFEPRKLIGLSTTDNDRVAEDFGWFVVGMLNGLLAEIGSIYSLTNGHARYEWTDPTTEMVDAMRPGLRVWAADGVAQLRSIFSMMNESYVVLDTRLTDRLPSRRVIDGGPDTTII